MWISKARCCLITLLSLNSANLFVVALPHKIHQLTSENRADAIKSAFKHAWDGYSKYAFGHDELMPISNNFSDSRNGWGATIFDALDTMIIMGLDDEYNTALKHVAQVDWTVTDTPSKTFETCIRYLGGLMSAYDLRPNLLLIRKAVELVNQVILPAFNTTSGIPSSFVDVPSQLPIISDTIVLAEFALQLEFVRLSQITGDPTYEIMANSIIEKISQVDTPIPGLYSIFWDPRTFEPSRTYITISGGGDSFYEYLLKTHILMDGENTQDILQLQMWEDAVVSMYYSLRSVSQQGDVFLSEDLDGFQRLKTGELVCFMPGNLLLGAKYVNSLEMATFAQELLDSCYKTWKKSPTGLSPEAWGWIDDLHYNTSNILYTPDQSKLFDQLGFIPNDLRYMLRPGYGVGNFRVD
ncbi:hypothetical protein INT47_011015 [Mucor saturninus]|uniref:alpha-1,2-Mannosidase n=1 Tax=Mucor saturninus TaxID=64648 RepID=A0A8H7REG3_9FUNG|nr:hypothetical protein INT47_011015 [Mucor saturninus]